VISPPARTVELLPGVSVLVRGWLHGNSVLLHGDAPALIDSGYHTGAAQLFAWLDERLGGAPLAELLLTHVHSDHGGGVSALRGRGALRVRASESAHDLVTRWDERGPWLGSSGQEMPRFHLDEAFAPGEVIEAAGRRFRVIATPGHTRCAVALFCEAAGLLITGDALWKNGFGMLDPWVEGPDCFDLAAQALRSLRALDGVKVVVPGHGAPFEDFAGALDRAEARLAPLRDDPDLIRKAVAQNGVGFLGMARPELGLAGLSEAVRRMVDEHPPLRPGPDTPSAEALVEQAFATMAARYAGTSRP
jgi:glyoxylase-like metal-dependent hydrolase (beta-lactamase superfamily II)